MGDRKLPQLPRHLVCRIVVQSKDLCLQEQPAALVAVPTISRLLAVYKTEPGRAVCSLRCYDPRTGRLAAAPALRRAFRLTPQPLPAAGGAGGQATGGGGANSSLTATASSFARDAAVSCCEDVQAVVTQLLRALTATERSQIGSVADLGLANAMFVQRLLANQETEQWRRLLARPAEHDASVGPMCTWCAGYRLFPETEPMAMAVPGWDEPDEVEEIMNLISTLVLF